MISLHPRHGGADAKIHCNSNDNNNNNSDNNSLI